MISPATQKTISSTLGELSARQATLQMHPDDARPRAVRTGDRVRVFNGLGEVEVTVEITDSIKRGTVSMPKGLWRRHTANGFTANVLVPDSLTDLGGGACFNDARCEVQRLTPAAAEARVG